MRYKPRPDHWDSDLDGAWEDDPGALIHSDRDVEDAAQDVSPPARLTATRGRGRGRGAKASPITTHKAVAASKSHGKGRGKKQVVEEEDDDDESDVNMLLEEDDEDLFVKAPTKTAPTRAVATSSRIARSSQPATKQSRLDFSQPAQTRARPVSSRAAAQKKQVIEVSDDDISDDDAFEPVAPPSRTTRSRR
jgi:double-strand break repair protein MRE11